jgi:hypothetical protein
MHEIIMIEMMGSENWCKKLLVNPEYDGLMDLTSQS